MTFCKIPSTFPTTCQLIIVELLIILISFVEVYYCHHISEIPYFVTFQTIPYLSTDKSTIHFKLRKNPGNNVYFSIIGYGAKTENKLSNFCVKKNCSIPLFIGGHVEFTIKDSKKNIYSQTLDLPRLNFSCTSPNWEDRMCYAKNICYNSGIFALTSPFPITFDQNMLTLGSRTPPVDFTFSRLSNRFKYQSSLPQGIPYLKNKTNLLSIFHHMEQEWHLYYDLLIPTFWTLTKDGYDGFKNHHLLFLSFCNQVPHIITSLSNHRLLCLDRPFCFEDLELGMVKVTNSTKNGIDPPYDFPNVSLRLFKKEIYRFFNISENTNDEIQNILLETKNKKDLHNNYTKEEELNNDDNHTTKSEQIHNTKEIDKKEQDDKNEIVKNDIIEKNVNNNQDNEKQLNNVIDQIPKKKKLKILIIIRFIKRKIKNIQEFISTVMDLFPDDEVEYKGFEWFSTKDQILAVKDFDVLIGIHGSALSNVIWMKENSTLVEIFPYKFTCRDWYEKASLLAKVNYIAYHPQSEKEAYTDKPDEMLIKCYQGKYACRSSYCLDRLRDQDIIIDLENFKKMMKSKFHNYR